MHNIRAVTVNLLRFCTMAQRRQGVFLYETVTKGAKVEKSKSLNIENSFNSCNGHMTACLAAVSHIYSDK